MNRYLGTIDVARLLGCSTERVRQLERDGKLPAEKMPNGRRIFRAEVVEQFAAERARRKGLNTDHK
jgi:excisionase family DNA binding protein